MQDWQTPLPTQLAQFSMQRTQIKPFKPKPGAHWVQTPLVEQLWQPTPQAMQAPWKR